MDRRTFLQGVGATAATLSVPSAVRSRGAEGDQSRRRLQGDPEAARRGGQAAPGLDQAAGDRGGEARRERGLRPPDPDAPGRRLRPRGEGADGRAARRLRDARRGRAGHLRRLLHVRRQAGRPVRVVLSALRGRAGRQAGVRQGRHGPRRGQPEGPRVGVPRGAARLQGRGTQAPRQPRARGGGRGGDRLAALPADRAAPGGRRRRSRSAPASSCRRRTRIRTAPSRSRWAPRASSSASSSASGEKWGRGPSKDIHSGNRPRVDSPAFHLVQALATLVTPDGTDPAIDGFADKARPISAAEKAMVAEAAKRMDEATIKKQLAREGVVEDRDLARVARARGLEADRQHRGPRRRLHRAGRQDDPAAQGRREDGPAPRARHDRRGLARRAQGAPRQAGLRRHRGQHDRRLRSQLDAGGRASSSRRSRRALSPDGERADPLAAQRRLLARATCSRASR